MSDPLMIYGATGFSGRLILHEALRRGLRPILGGRDAGKLAAIAEPLGLTFRTVPLTDPGRLDAALRDLRVVLHAAGPFSETSAPMVHACLRTGTHYLDVTAEVRVIEALVQRDREARQRGIMLMPAVGFDVVPSDCLAAHVARRLPDARRLALGMAGLRASSRGSAKTLVEAANFGIVRRNGVITPVPLGSLQEWFDYGDGAKLSLNISWGDLASAYYTTGIPNIETYWESTPLLDSVLRASRYFGWFLQSGPWQVWLKAHIDLLPEGPTEEECAASPMVLVARADDGKGNCVSSRLRTPNAYVLTAMTAAAIAQRALQDDVEIGFQTPARVYGADFILSFPTVSREDLA